MAPSPSRVSPVLAVAILALACTGLSTADAAKSGSSGSGDAAKETAPAARGPRRGVPRSPKQWNRLSGKDIEQLEKEWEDGDDPDLLKTEDQLLFEEMERRRKQPPKVDPSNPKGFMEAAMLNQGGSPQAMMFATLTKEDPATGKERTKESTGILAAQWRDLLFTGGVNATCYDIEPSILLCTLMRGWFAAQMKEFMIRQPGVVEVEWNQVKYKPGDVKDDDDDDDDGVEVVGKRGKKRRKKAPEIKLPKPKKKPQAKKAGSGGKAKGGRADKDEL